MVRAFPTTTEAEESPASVDDFLREARELVDLHGSRVSFPEGRRELGVFCSRALDMKDISTIGAYVRVSHEEGDRQREGKRVVVVAASVAGNCRADEGVGGGNG